MAKSFIDRHPPRVNWNKLRNGPTPADLKAVPPASAEEWERDGYLVATLPGKVARKLNRRTKASPRAGRKGTGIE